MEENQTISRLRTEGSRRRRGQKPNPQIPDWGIKSTPAKGCRTGTPATWAGGPVRQPFSGVDVISQSEIYEFGYREDPLPEPSVLFLPPGYPVINPIYPSPVFAVF